MERKLNFKNTKSLTVILIVLFSILSVLVVVSFLWPGNIVEAQPLSNAYSNGTGNVLPAYTEQSIPDLFNKLKDSVVKISPTSKESNASLQGSGFVYDKNGHIVTNSHVVGKASSVVVTFNDGNQYNALVKGKDPTSDIAVLKISGNHTQPLIPVIFDNSSEIMVGERVIAIGNPYGFTNTLTGGFISQTGRLILESGSEAPYPQPNMIQTDALINPGNSGGPLVNLEGNVIGMNTATFNSQLGGATGLGFAVPSNTLVREIPVIIENASYPHPWLGISAKSLTSEVNQILGLDPFFKGVLVGALVTDGPAEEAGVQGKNGSYFGDIITALDGVPISNVHDLLSYINENKRVGENIIVSLFKNNEINNLNLTLGERPTSLYTSSSISSKTPLF
jgi:S1-C subfamily serine protease